MMNLQDIKRINPDSVYCNYKNKRTNLILNGIEYAAYIWPTYIFVVGRHEHTGMTLTKTFKYTKII